MTPRRSFLASIGAFLSAPLAAFGRSPEPGFNDVEFCMEPYQDGEAIAFSITWRGEKYGKALHKDFLKTFDRKAVQRFRATDRAVLRWDQESGEWR
jgi:hypothetical protein